jgi:hypothetical protein
MRDGEAAIGVDGMIEEKGRRSGREREREREREGKGIAKREGETEREIKERKESPRNEERARVHGGEG